MYFVCYKNFEVKYMVCRVNDVEEYCIFEIVKQWFKKNLKNGVFFIFQNVKKYKQFNI